MNYAKYQQEHKPTWLKRRHLIPLKPPLIFFLPFPHWRMIQQVCQLDSDHFRSSSSEPLRVIILSLLTHTDSWRLFYFFSRWNVYLCWKTRAMLSSRALPRHIAHALLLYTSEVFSGFSPRRCERSAIFSISDRDTLSKVNARACTPWIRSL